MSPVYRIFFIYSLWDQSVPLLLWPRQYDISSKVIYKGRMMEQHRTHPSVKWCNIRMQILAPVLRSIRFLWLFSCHHCHQNATIFTDHLLYPSKSKSKALLHKLLLIKPKKRGRKLKQNSAEGDSSSVCCAGHCCGWGKDHMKEMDRKNKKATHINGTPQMELILTKSAFQWGAGDESD